MSGRVGGGGGGEAWRDLGGSLFKGFHESGPFVRGSPIVAVDRRILLLLLRTDFVVSDHYAQLAKQATACSVRDLRGGALLGAFHVLRIP